MSQTLVVDNGAHAIKVGFATDSYPKVIPNCITKVKSERRRPFIGDQMEECKDYSQMFYLIPFQKGYLINYDLERQIWDYIFKTKLKVDYSDTTLIITEPTLNFKPIQENLTEILYEEYGFASLLRTSGPHLAAHKYSETNKTSLATLVVDTGFSFTHIVPFIKNKRITESIRRIDVGGKALTNHLKDIISYRQLNVLDETYVVNQMKEDCCYVSNQFWKDLEISRTRKNSIVRDYILPDYTIIKRGYVRNPEDKSPITDHQVIRMNNERFQVPELLFYPSDVDIDQIGISHTIGHSIDSIREEVRPHLYENILVIGGNACFKGIKERIYTDIRSMAPHLYDVNVCIPENPITYIWESGKCLAQNSDLMSRLCITKKEYEEQGLNFCIEKFDI
ncbi:actin-related protein 6-like [Oppia nitens]|uniref:actin-related protein 6-like n=1 Tax=Oppia nitens TaxID=1686743 RepID=UPI0023DC4AF6|nr:actin-related protein 6-like [Oppia nitens]